MWRGMGGLRWVGGWVRLGGARGSGISAGGHLPHLPHTLPALFPHTGPWKGAWVRRGYDPRATQEARGWQVVPYQLPSDWWVGGGWVGRVQGGQVGR